MKPAHRIVPFALLATPLLVASVAVGQQPTDPMPRTFYRAYYLEHEEGRLEAALELYQEVAESGEVSGAQSAIAARHAAAVREELAAHDLASLFPQQTLAYVELNDPGARFGALLDRLGLLQGKDGALDAPFSGISPALVNSLLGLRGMAAGLTRVNPMTGQPGLLAVLHPGDYDLLRGAIDTLAPAELVPAESVAGHATYAVPDVGYLTMSERLVVIATSRHDISKVLRQAQEGGPSFLDSPSMQSTEDLRGEDLAFFCLNVEPLGAMANLGLGMAMREDPRLAAVAEIFDVDSMRAIAGRIGLGAEGLGLDLAMQMREGHTNRFYNFFRIPTVDLESIAMVPDGAAFFVATALNEEARGDVGLTDSAGRPVVTFMDLGRELFGNVVDLAVFALPDVDESRIELDEGVAQAVAAQAGQSFGGEAWDSSSITRAFSLVPQVALVLRVNDAERSRAMWDLVLRTACLASGQRPSAEEVAGFQLTHYALEATDVWLGETGQALVLSPSRTAVERALVAKRSGYSVAQDDCFRAAMERFGEDKTLAVFASPGRIARLNAQLSFGAEAEALQQVGDLFGDAAISFGVAHSETRMGIGVHFTQVPNVNGLVAEWLGTRGLIAPGRVTWAEEPAVAPAPSVARAAEAAREPRSSARAAAVRADAPAPSGGSFFDRVLGRGEGPRASDAVPAPAPAADATGATGMRSTKSTSARVAPDAPDAPDAADAPGASERPGGEADRSSLSPHALASREVLALAETDAAGARDRVRALAAEHRAEPAFLDGFTRELLASPAGRTTLAKVALEVAQRRAEETDYANSVCVATLATARSLTGEVDLAIELQELAIELCDDEPARVALQRDLESLRAAREAEVVATNER